MSNSSPETSNKNDHGSPHGALVFPSVGYGWLREDTLHGALYVTTVTNRDGSRSPVVFAGQEALDAVRAADRSNEAGAETTQAVEQEPALLPTDVDEAVVAAGALVAASRTVLSGTGGLRTLSSAVVATSGEYV